MPTLTLIINGQAETYRKVTTQLTNSGRRAIGGTGIYCHECAESLRPDMPSCPNCNTPTLRFLTAA